MFSKILVKLVDEAILPAILLLATRVVSVVLVARYFDISYTIGPTGFIFPQVKNFVIVNSYATLSMIIVLAVGLLYVLLKSHIFHESHISPGLTAKMYSLRLSSFVQASFDLYSQGTIWLSYAYLLLIASGVMAVFDILYPWVFIVSLVLTVISTTLFIFDVEHELKAEKENISDEEDFVLNLGDVDEY